MFVDRTQVEGKSLGVLATRHQGGTWMEFYGVLPLLASEKLVDIYPCVQRISQQPNIQVLVASVLSISMSYKSSKPSVKRSHESLKKYNGQQCMRCNELATCLWVEYSNLTQISLGFQNIRHTRPSNLPSPKKSYESWG
jgi:hypothetical protein